MKVDVLPKEEDMLDIYKWPDPEGDRAGTMREVEDGGGSGKKHTL
jgi:hypothetical protein